MDDKQTMDKEKREKKKVAAERATVKALLDAQTRLKHSDPNADPTLGSEIKPISKNPARDEDWEGKFVDMAKENKSDTEGEDEDEDEDKDEDEDEDLGDSEYARKQMKK